MRKNKPRIFVGIFIYCCLLLGCSGDNFGPTEGEQQFGYHVLSDERMESIKQYLDSREYSPVNASTVYSTRLDTRAVQLQEMNIIRYEHTDHVGFGAVVFPEGSDLLSAPVAMLLTGLNQSDPEVFIHQLVIDFQYFAPQLTDFILIIPSFRGNLIQQGKTFQSTGDFCDAYDGAATDSILFFEAVKKVYPEINTDKILVTGGSRGGNVAHLVGQRDERVKMVIAMAAPTDFYRESVKEHYKEQYQCQFFEGKTAAQATQKLVLSSPQYFAKHSPTTRIHHANSDGVVPVWHGKEMYAKLLQENKDVIFYQYEKGGHSDFYTKSPLFRENFTTNVYEFLAM